MISRHPSKLRSVLLWHAVLSSPSPIQSILQAWPVALQGRDVVAVAKTGSGKTCGFLLPGFLHIEKQRIDSRRGPGMLVLAPTRELATQIKEEADKFGRGFGITNTCCYGGAPKGMQLRDLRNGCKLVSVSAPFFLSYVSILFADHCHPWSPK